MEQMNECESTREEIKGKLRQYFDGKIVRKDLTKKIKEGANVPVYVLEFLLGQYCSSDDEEVIEDGVQKVKRILADNFVRPDEAQKILSQLRKKGSHTIIDMVTVHLDIKKNCYFTEFSNLGLGNVPIADEYPEKFDRLLCGGIWCIVQLDYEAEGDNNFGIEDINGNPLRSKQKKQKEITPISIRKLTPIQMPHIDIAELKQGRKAFTKEEWMDVLLRSIGMEPDALSYREKWLLLTRWWKITSIFANWDPAVPVNPTCIKRFLRTAYWFPAVRQRSPTSSITWEERQSVWSVCGTVLPLTK